MNVKQLEETAHALFASDKGLLAMDESNPTCNKRFAQLGIPQTVEARRAYREMIVSTPGLGESISGAILYDETIPTDEKWHSVCHGPQGSGDRSWDQGRPGRQEFGRLSRRKNYRRAGWIARPAQ